MKNATWRALPLLVVAMICSCSSSKALTSSSGVDDSSAACPAAVASTFAWWVGKWGYFIQGYDPGNSTVTATNGGCGLAEAFVDRSGAQQHTTIQYDSVGKQWKRHVVDPFRAYDSTGQFASDGSIAFYETTVSRESYRPTDKDHVHFVGESSKDGGKTWSVDFDALYTRTP